MHNPLNLLTSIKPPAINPVNEVRPVSPIQGDPRQGFSGLLQQAAQQHAAQRPATPQPSRPAPPRPMAQATPPRPQPAPAQKPAASAPPAQAQRSAPPERPRPAQQDTQARPVADHTQRAGQRQAAATADPGKATATDTADRRDDGTTDTRTERSPLDAMWDLLGHGRIDPQAQAEALGALNETGDESLDEDTLAELDAAAQGVVDGALLPGVDTLAPPNSSPVQADPALASSLASSLAAQAGTQAEAGESDAAGVSAGAAGDTTVDLAATGAAANDAAGRGAIELTDSTALATHESFQQALADGQMQGDKAAATAALRQPAVAAPAAAAEPGAPGTGAQPVHGTPLTATTPTAATSAASSSAAMTGAAYALGTPVDSPEFPQAMATQISYFVREGIQQAQLHLNPAEMGPVSVQIALNGQQAQVDFAAASSATRAAIENSLSDLAASLQSAGFTLTGGGVSQQSHQSHQSQQQGAGQLGSEARLGQGKGDTPEAAAASPVLHHRNGSGGLDLYA